MPTPIHRDRLVELLDEGAQLVEVLPRDEYDEEHLPEAVHLPLRQIAAATVAQLDPGKPTVVYCWDGL